VSSSGWLGHQSAARTARSRLECGDGEPGRKYLPNQLGSALAYWIRADVVVNESSALLIEDNTHQHSDAQA
jgi:hypothetical protein